MLAELNPTLSYADICQLLIQQAAAAPADENSLTVMRVA